jgi:hypothetical protein
MPHRTRRVLTRPSPTGRSNWPLTGQLLAPGRWSRRRHSCQRQGSRSQETSVTVPQVRSVLEVTVAPLLSARTHAQIRSATFSRSRGQPSTAHSTEPTPPPPPNRPSTSRAETSLRGGTPGRDATLVELLLTISCGTIRVSDPMAAPLTRYRTVAPETRTGTRRTRTDCLEARPVALRLVSATRVRAATMRSST